MGSWVFDLGSRQITWSEGMYRILGLPPRNAAHSEAEVFEHVHPADREWMEPRGFGSSFGSALALRSHDCASSVAMRAGWASHTPRGRAHMPWPSSPGPSLAAVDWDRAAV